MDYDWLILNILQWCYFTVQKQELKYNAKALEHKISPQIQFPLY